MKHIQIKNIDKWSEETLIKECIEKNEKAQKYLFDSYYNKMFGLCMRYFDNEDESHDVLNQAFLKIFSKLKQLKDTTSLNSWMRRTVVNTAIDHIRKNKSYHHLFVKTEKFSHYNEEDEISEWWEVALKIPQEQLFIEVNRLPKASRLVFNLFVIDNLKHKEIANKLKISESTSRWHLSNAREILKERVITIINKELMHGQQQQKKY